MVSPSFNSHLQTTADRCNHNYFTLDGCICEFARPRRHARGPLAFRERCKQSHVSVIDIFDRGQPLTSPSYRQRSSDYGQWKCGDVKNVLKRQCTMTTTRKKDAPFLQSLASKHQTSWLTREWSTRMVNIWTMPVLNCEILHCIIKFNTPNICTLLSKCSSKTSPYIGAFVFPSILTSLPVPTAGKHAHGMMQPLPMLMLMYNTIWKWLYSLK